MNDIILQQLEIATAELGPVRNESGEIIDFEWLEVNAVANFVLYQGKQSAVGKRILKTFPDLKDSPVMDLFVRACDGGESGTLTSDQKHIKAFGDRIYRFSAAPSERGCITSFQEVTQFTKQVEAARNRARLLLTASDNSVEGLVLTGPTGEIIYINNAACKLVGYTDSELEGESINKIVHADGQALDREMAEKLRSGELKQDIRDKKYVRKDGKIIDVSAAMSAVLNPESGEYTYIGHIRDVTEARKTARALTDALAKAEESARMKSEFLANMSHEIRTPLNGVLGMAQSLRHSALSDAQSEQVGLILESGTALMALLNDILDLSKIEAGRIDISPIETDLRHKLSGISRVHKMTASEKGVSLRMVVDPSVPSRLFVDPVRLRQCIDNLVGNALKFTSEGEVMIVATCDPAIDGQHRLVFHVTDTGIGIPKDKIDQIFDVFSQADGSTTRNYGGTGLGLPIARRLAQAMGGDVSVVSEPGRGSVFTLTLQAGAAEIDRAEFGGDQAQTGNRRQPTGGMAGRRVLVVDDNRINRNVARTFLQVYRMCVTEAEDGREALAELEKAAFDLVLMDVHMPRMDGATALTAIQTNPEKYGTAPTIALTADALNGDREKYIAMGFHGYISKPIDERELASEVMRVVAGKSSAANARKSA